MITIRDLIPVRQGRPVLSVPLSLTADRGTITVIMGASGVGKTTLLDAVRGDIMFQGHVQGHGRTFSVYQGDNQLFPWYSVRRNFELAGCDSAWLDIADRWRIAHLVDARPGDMSGGQRQRFVLLRALTQGADLLLCDEPLNHLDMLSSKVIARDFRDTVKQTQTTVIWITHDIVEASVLADHCYVMTKQGLHALDHNNLDFHNVEPYLEA